MMTRLRKAMKTSAERREARRIFRATVHLDPHILKDIGITRYDLARTAYRNR